MRVAVLGLGSVGSRHAENLLALGHDVVGWDPGSRPSPSGLVRTESIGAALETADAAVIASPSAFHAEQATLALEAGRHVLLEKPPAVTVEDAARLTEVAERSGLVCAVAMNLRFLPAIRRLKALVEEGTLGRMLLASAWFGHDLRRWRPQDDYRASYSARAELGGGIVLDAIHELDYLLWLLGPVSAVSADVARVSDLEVDVEDTAVASLRFASGALASLQVDFVEQAYRRGCVLAGTQATARWHWNEGRIVVESDEDRRVLEVAADVEETYRDELVDFVEAIESERPPAVSPADGLAAVRLADAIKRSAAEGRRVELE